MAMEGEGIKFLNSLSSRLAESFGFEIFDYYSTDADFYDILKGSIDSLPSCELKDHLLENTSRYRDQLKSLLESKFKSVTIPNCSALTSESVSESLKTIKASKSNPNLSKEEICHMYKQLLVSSSSNKCISFKEIINEWAEYLVHSSDGDSILEAIEFLSQCLLNTETLIFCVDTFIYLYSHLLTIGATPSTNKILSVIFAVYFLASRPEFDGRDNCYDNQLSALLSIYIECCLLNSDEDVNDLSSHLTRTLLTFSGKGVIALSSLLQINVPNGKEDVILELIKSVLNWIQFSSFGLRHNVCDFHVYLCYICCLNFAKRLSCGSSKHFESKCYLKAPSLFSDWLYSADSSICETLGIKRTWSSEQIHEYLLSGFTKEKEELLLDLLSHTDGTKEKNSSSSDSLREDTKEKEEVLNAETNGVFFLDNEGEDIASVTKEWSSEEDRNEETQEVTHACIPVYMETNETSYTETSKVNEEEGAMNDNYNDAISEEVTTTPIQRVSSAKKRKSLLKKLRKSTTPPMKVKFSPRILRSATKKKLLASAARPKN